LMNLSWLLLALGDETLHGLLDQGIKFMQEHKIRKYNERYPDDQYFNVVTDQNREAIPRLDILVDEVNESVDSRQIEREELLLKYTEMIKIIYGNTDRI